MTICRKLIQTYDLIGDAKDKTVTVVAAPSQTITLKFTDKPIPPEPPYQAGLFDKPKRIKAERAVQCDPQQLADFRSDRASTSR